MDSTATQGGTTTAASTHTKTVGASTVASASSAAAAVTTATTSSSTGGIATRDHVYCLELAKRSVARAALHLGIQNMTSDVLNVLGDVLCEYIQRLAAVLSHNVESSNRSSQHVNALDTLRAVELCTSPAVSRVHFINTTNSDETGTTGAGASNPTNGNSATGTTNHNMMEENGNSTSSGSNNNGNNNPTHPPTSWQGLAAFCFGPNWQEAPTSKELEVAELQGAGGKVGPKAMGDDDDEDDEDGGMGRGAKDCQEGWRAPFPDEVPQFPQCTSPTAVSNPHAMTNTQVLTALYGKQQTKQKRASTAAKVIADLVRGPDLVSSEEAQQERQVIEDDLNRIPVSAWGGLGDTKSSHTNKNPIGITSARVSEAVPSATKINEDTTMTNADDGPANTNSNKRKLEEDKDSNTNGAAAADKDSSDSNNNKKDGDNKKEDDNKDKMDTSGDDGKKDKGKKDDKKSEGDGSKPPKKKVKLEDGSAAKAKSTPKKSKKKTDDKKDNSTESKTKDGTDANKKKDGDATKDNEQAAEGGSGAAGALGTGLDSASSHHGGKGGPLGPTYNYVPTFYPPIPTMATAGEEVRKTTVVDLLEQPASTSATASGSSGSDGAGGETDPTEASNTTTSGLRSALVQLGTSYWGSQADFAPPPAPASSTTNNNKLGDASVVPVGRSQAPAPPSGPIVPLGRASGSRVSRILEGSMDAAAMQQ